MSIADAVVALPIWLVVTQWVLLFALSFFVLLAYRQLGFMLRLKDIGSDRDGLSLGDEAPAFEYHSVDHDTDPVGRFDPVGRWSILLFADPGCVSCQTAVVGLQHLALSLPEAQILVATSAEPEVIAAVDQFREASIPIRRVSRDVPSKLYRTMSTPYAYIIDPKGVIKVKGVAADEATLGKLIQKADRRPIVSVESASHA